MPLMKSLRELRLSNTSGHCVLVEAGVPKLIPPGLMNEAIQAGMVKVKDQPDSAEAQTTAEAEAETEKAAANEELRVEQLRQALMIVITRANEDDFKKDNTPKATRVLAELPPEFSPRPSATEILDAYEELQADINLAED